MKTAIRFILAFILLIFVDGKVYSANFFRTINIDQNYDIVGLHPVEDELIGKVNIFYYLDYDENNRLVSVQYIENGRLAIDPFFGVSKVLIEYSEGWERWSFLDEYGFPKENNKGVYFYQIQINGEGFKQALINHDSDWNISENELGVFEYNWVLDEKGRRVSSFRLNENNEKISDLNEVFETRFKYDEDGRLIELSNHGTAGQLVLDKESGVAITSWGYNDRGDIAEESYYGVDSHPILDKEFGVAKWNWKWNEKGNIVEESCYGVDGQLILDKKNGVALTKLHHDNNGNLTELRNYGTDDRLILNKVSGVAIIRFQYSSNGNRIEESFFDTDERPILDKVLGLAMVRWKYDEKGNFIEKSYYGIDGQLISNKNHGFAIIRWEYDEEGNFVEENHFDARGNLIVDEN